MLATIDGRTYPLESTRVASEASGGLAFTTLAQTYRNPYAEPLEIVYTLPLPADGAVVGYTMRVGSRTIRGEVQPRAAARQAFEKAMFEGRSAALLEQERDDTFRQRLGSLPPGLNVEVTIEVLHPLAFLTGVDERGPQWEYRFPTVVGVRYQGAEGRVPDADRLEVDRAARAGAIPTRVELALTILDDSGRTDRRVESMPLDRDLVIRWPAGRDDIGLRLLEGPGLPGDAGRYGLLTIVPPRVPESVFARDLTILLDASGSMSGEPIAWAKNVASGVLRSLGPGDRFEVIVFSSTPRSLTGGLVEASSTRVASTLGDLAQVRAAGGTEMADAVVAALRPLREGSQHQVVLITDGEIGFEDEIVSRIVKGLPDGARLHTVGIGAAPNRTLTSRAARAGRGVESFVCGDSEVPGAVLRICAATAHPVLTDVTVVNSAGTGAMPARPRDVLAGQPSVVAFALSPEGGAIDVSGRLAGARGRWTSRIFVPPAGVGERSVTTMPLGALYAREQIADLETRGPNSDELVEKIAMRHRIASRMTSLVAVADEPSIDPRQPRRREVLPIELPATMSAEAVGLTMGSELAVAKRLFAPSALRRRHVPMSVEDAALSFSDEEDLGTPQWAEPTVPHARVIAVEGFVLIVEFEAPEDGYVLRSGHVLVSHDPASRQPVSLDRGTVDPAKSSPRGPHAKGLVLRLAIVGTSAWTYGVGDQVVIF